MILLPFVRGDNRRSGSRDYACGGGVIELLPSSNFGTLVVTRCGGGGGACIDN